PGPERAQAGKEPLRTSECACFRLPSGGTECVNDSRDGNRPDGRGGGHARPPGRTDGRWERGVHYTYTTDPRQANWRTCTLSRFLMCDEPAPGLSSGNLAGGFMFQEIDDRASVRPRRVHRAALALALLTAFAGASWTSANNRDHEQDQERNNRGEDDRRRNDRDER